MERTTRINTIAVLTSGGDAPGMNAAIRAVTRTAIDAGGRVFGVRHGYAGLLNNEFIPLDSRAVSGVIQRGGTMLGSARSAAFKTEDGQMLALRHLAMQGVDGLVVIGGNGSQTGAYMLSKAGFPVVGIASTIDNDLYGSDITIGVDTALNTALDAIDKIKDTAASHERAFLVEVMGRDSGYLALMTGIAGGAEAIVIPEIETTPETVRDQIREAYRRGKNHAIVVVAEGAKYDAMAIQQTLLQQDHLGFDIRVIILGHVQRGGSPQVFDRLLATRLGTAAVHELSAGHYGVLVGLHANAVVTTPLEDVAGKKKPLDLKLMEMAQTLAM